SAHMRAPRAFCHLSRCCAPPLPLHSFPTRRSSDLLDAREHDDADAVLHHALDARVDELRREVVHPSRIRDQRHVVARGHLDGAEIGRAHVCTPVTDQSRMTSSACNDTKLAALYPAD